MNGGQNPTPIANPYADQANPYVGDNPYLQATAQNVAGNMANAYETGTVRLVTHRPRVWVATVLLDGTRNASATKGAFAQQLGNTMNQLYGDEVR